MTHPPVRRERRLRHYLRLLGPGLITGASDDDDPAGIATYAVAGASLGYSTLWTAAIMGDQTNGLMLNVLGWATAAIMGAAGLAFVLRSGA